MERVEKKSQEKLERSLLELGTQIVYLKDEISSMKKSHNDLLQVMKGLRLLLDDKGVICLDDFDSLVELGAALSSAPSLETNDPRSQSRLKKPWH